MPTKVTSKSKAGVMAPMQEGRIDYLYTPVGDTLRITAADGSEVYVYLTPIDVRVLREFTNESKEGKL